MEAKQQYTSFVKKDDLVARMEEEKKAAQPKPPLEEIEPAAAVKEPASPEASKEELDEKKREAQLIKYQQEYEKRTGVRLNEEQIQDYIFKGRLFLSDVQIIPGKLTGRFQTHTPAEAQYVEERLASLRNEGKLTLDGLDNEKSMIVLSLVWLSAGGRSLGDTKEARENTIRKMGAHVVEMASESWTAVNFLLKYSLREGSFLKKS
jgi:hypothetical protein